MRWLLVLLAWVGSAALLAPVCFFVTLFLAGPHSSMLPGFLQPLVLLLGWAVFLVAPLLVARAVWRRTGRGPGAGAA
jgi:hypothetical protein